MVLSDRDIKKYIEGGLIKISDFKEEYLNPASYAFHLGRSLLRPGVVDVIDFKHDKLPEYEKLELTDAGYKLMPGEFILGETEEILSLSDGIGMIIEGRSSLARVGIEVTQTSTFVEPDHRDSLITLEIKNNGNNPFMLYHRMKFAKGIFLQLSSNQDNLLGRGSTYSGENKQDDVSQPQINRYFS